MTAPSHESKLSGGAVTCELIVMEKIGPIYRTNATLNMNKYKPYEHWNWFLFMCIIM